jgi:nicotinamidase-related amidase
MQTSDSGEQPRRSPELLSRHHCGLLVVDVQEKLLKAIPAADRLVWNIRRLLYAARLLQVPSAATEQYPQGLGPTSAALRQLVPPPAAKQRFSCCDGQALPSDWPDRGISQMLVVGLEAHVCVLQTVLDLLSDGYRVFVAADAVASRAERDAEIALRRMESSGATLVTVEAVLFEWCETSAAAEFKQISQLVREAGP